MEISKTVARYIKGSPRFDKDNSLSELPPVMDRYGKVIGT